MTNTEFQKLADKEVSDWVDDAGRQCVLDAFAEVRAEIKNATVSFAFHIVELNDQLLAARAEADALREVMGLGEALFQALKEQGEPSYIHRYAWGEVAIDGTYNMEAVASRFIDLIHCQGKR